MGAIYEWAAQAYRECRRDWEEYVASQYARAERDLGPALLSRKALDQGVTGISLWTMQFDRAWRLATPELRDWWARNDRITFAAFESAWMVGRYE